MIRVALAAFILASSASVAVAQPTDFGIRQIGGPKVVTPIVQEGTAASSATSPTRSSNVPASLLNAARIGSQLGRVTSMRRSPEHNRRVGGVANSYHLSGRAIDIARRAGVSHSQIAAALRSAGYQLIESLDEGDHSHFAFNFGAGQRLQSAVALAAKSGEVTTWHMVYAPGSASRTASR